jgi:hypothetical protein
MKIIILFIFIISTNLFAQNPNWVRTNGPFGCYSKVLYIDSEGEILSSYQHYSLLSTDRGKHWMTTDNYDITAVKYDKDTIYYGNDRGLVIGNYPDIDLPRFLIYPDKEDIMTAVLNITKDSLNNIYAYLNDYGHLFSTDNGKTWTKIEMSPTVIDDKNNFYRYKNGKFQISSDFGKSWNSVLVDTNIYLLDNRIGTYNKKDSSIYYFAFNNKIVKFYKTGSEWSNQILSSPFLYPYGIYSDKNEDLYAYGDTLLCKSIDAGKNWQVINKDFPLVVNSISRLDSLLFIGTEKHGLIRYNVNSNKFLNYEEPSTNAYISKLYCDSNNNVYSKTLSGIYKTTDNGLNWIHLITPFQELKYKSFYTSKNGNLYLSDDNAYFSKSGYFISTNQGLSWTFNELGDANTKKFIFAENNYGIFAGSNKLFFINDFGNYLIKSEQTFKRINNILIFRSNTMLVADWNNGVFFSENRGDTFIKLNSSDSLQCYVDLSFSLNGFMFISKTFGESTIYSKDLGKNFLNFPTFYQTFERSVKFDLQNNLFLLEWGYPNYFCSIKKTSNWGLKWESITFPTWNIDGLWSYGTDIIFLSNNKAMAGTPYDGVLLNDKYNSIEENYIRSDAGIITPNPTTDYIEIVPPLEKRGLGGVLPTIEIFNIFGECMLSVETGLRPVSTKIDVSALPAGVYFVRIGEKVEKFVKINN